MGLFHMLLRPKVHCLDCVYCSFFLFFWVWLFTNNFLDRPRNRLRSTSDEDGAATAPQQQQAGAAAPQQPQAQAAAARGGRFGPGGTGTNGWVVLLLLTFAL